MTVPSARAAFAMEWTKIRTVRATVWTLLLTFVISVGIGALVSMSIRNGFENMSAERQAEFDPVLFGFLSLGLGQISLVVFGVLLVSTEYTSGMIRASLAAVPRRGVFWAAKIAAGTAVALPVSVAIAFATFFAAQHGLGPHGTSLGEPGVLRATIGACLYMTLMCVLAMGVAAMLRGTALSLGIMIPLLFLNSQGLSNIPAIRGVTQFLPDQAGAVMMQVVPRGESAIGHTDFGPWTGLAIMTAWAAAALIGGYLLLRRRDA